MSYYKTKGRCTLQVQKHGGVWMAEVDVSQEHGPMAELCCAPATSYTQAVKMAHAVEKQVEEGSLLRLPEQAIEEHYTSYPKLYYTRWCALSWILGYYGMDWLDGQKVSTCDLHPDGTQALDLYSEISDELEGLERRAFAPLKHDEPLEDYLSRYYKEEQFQAYKAESKAFFERPYPLDDTGYAVHDAHLRDLEVPDNIHPKWLEAVRELLIICGTRCTETSARLWADEQGKTLEARFPTRFEPLNLDMTSHPTRPVFSSFSLTQRSAEKTAKLLTAKERERLLCAYPKRFSV